MMADSTAQARFNMVEQQIRPWEIFDPKILHLMEVLPREQFVPEAYQHLAYADIEIPIGHGQSMMFPRMEARLLQALDLKSADRVLEVGTGSGFLTACLANLSGQVVSIDTHTDFTESASERLQDLKLANVQLLSGDALTAPLGETGPFDAIAITGSLPAMTHLEPFRKLLKTTGRLFVVVGTPPVMEALLITRISDTQFSQEQIFETELAPLENAILPAVFEF
ncbi:MAG: protein-L-isoaspartate O-methyltransferase [Gammaproteobacteria bacterium]|nr:protein-L-isoaspartate O-methyltransferase [Gammaproteobacteria bacterium]